MIRTHPLTSSRWPLLAWAFGLMLAAPLRGEEAAEWRFDLHLGHVNHGEAFSGPVYIFFSDADAEPRKGPNWFSPEPFFSVGVTDWEPGTVRTVSTADPSAKFFPRKFHQQSLIGQRAQAVVRLNPLERQVGSGPGNGYSRVVSLETRGPVRLMIDRTVPAPEFQETEWTRLLSVRSERLSRFHDREVRLKAAVTLPASYFDTPEQRYPVILEIPGFGGTHLRGVHRRPVEESNGLGVEFIRVMLDPSCPLGHHVFANSDNNGPYGDALVEEFLPALDREYRTVAEPRGRFLTGHSSGGWSSLWLQVSYPETFAGTWSTAPDPVDFRSFQGIDVYRPGENMYATPEGDRRPLGRGKNGEVAIWYRDFADMEEVLGHGGQLHSFEAVFSPRGENGEPLRLWDRESGELHAAVAKSWKRYDIRLILEERWETLGPRLEGKLHVFMGTLDTFYLERSTELLKETLQGLGSDAVVEMIPDRDHFNLFAGGLKGRIERQMAAKYLNVDEGR